MKRVLIISPYFPPSNAADMQRVRMSLPYFKKFGWECEVVAVDERFSELEKDDLLLKTIPAEIKIHKLQLTAGRKLIGGMAMRSFSIYRKFVSRLLTQHKFDLIYFSTTQFLLCALGPVWKKRFNVPYIIDMQDPWYTGRYQHIEYKNLKSGAMYILHRYFERKAMSGVSGLISVSKKYIDDLANAYPHLAHIPSAVVPFGSAEKDFDIASRNAALFNNMLDPATKNIVYIGRGGEDLHRAITPLFIALKESSTINQSIKIYFIGTSYYAEGDLQQAIAELAAQTDVAGRVVEINKRVGYFHTLSTLKKADALFIPGSDDAGYNASKIHPYILAEKPVLSIVNTQSPAFAMLKEYGVSRVFGYNDDIIVNRIKAFLTELAEDKLITDTYNTKTIAKYSAENMTQQQCALFDAVLQIAE